MLLPSSSFLVVFKAFTFIFYWKKFLFLVLNSSTDLTAKATKFVTIILATYIFFSCHCVYHFYIYEPLIIPFCPMYQNSLLLGNCSLSLHYPRLTFFFSTFFIKLKSLLSGWPCSLFKWLQTCQPFFLTYKEVKYSFSKTSKPCFVSCLKRIINN